MIAYKLVRVKHNKHNLYYPLFINRKEPISTGIWYEADDHPTKGYANRPGWHCCKVPYAPHLHKQDGCLAEDRVWVEVDIPDCEVKEKECDGIPHGGFYKIGRYARFPNEWYVSGSIRVIRMLSDEEADSINEQYGILQKITR